jgi:hypothetical protein
MSEQVEGQMQLSDEYASWREVPAMGATAIVSATAEHEPYEMPEEIVAEERALVTVDQPQHHLITGMATLARMSEDEFQAAMEVIERGQKRMREFQQRAMVKGEDYGVVKGIDRPFLHLPGAEKMTLLYGLAVRQEAERLVGDGISSPPLAYHVKSYVHVGSFDGPVVAMGYGEASSWEVKYRYTWAKAVCPGCQREGMVRGKPDGKLKGKWWCPSREGGCNRTFEPNDPAITPPGKVENTDPYSLAETLLQMAAKRSFVAATRRATGTSGLFTQDEDSPSVQQQADQAPPDDGSDPVISAVPAGTTVTRGGRSDQPTAEQLARLSKISKEKDLGPAGIAVVIVRLAFGDPVLPADGDRPAQGRALLAWINANMSADQMGALLVSLDTGEVPA